MRSRGRTTRPSLSRSCRAPWCASVSLAGRRFACRRSRRDGARGERCSPRVARAARRHRDAALVCRSYAVCRGRDAGLFDRASADGATPAAWSAPAQAAAMSRARRALRSPLRDPAVHAVLELGLTADEAARCSIARGFADPSRSDRGRALLYARRRGHPRGRRDRVRPIAGCSAVLAAELLEPGCAAASRGSRSVGRRCTAIVVGRLLAAVAWLGGAP